MLDGREGLTTPSRELNQRSRQSVRLEAASEIQPAINPGRARQVDG
jgi:hypothetical protein